MPRSRASVVLELDILKESGVPSETISRVRCVWKLVAAHGRVEGFWRNDGRLEALFGPNEVCAQALYDDNKVSITTARPSPK